MKITQLASDLENLSDQAESNEKLPPVSQLINFWPVIRTALVIAKFFTGPKGDKAIDEIIKWGDLLSFAGKTVRK